MSDLLDDYRSLVGRYVEGALSAAALQSAYLDRFKAEKRPMSEDEYQLLDTFFADLDSYTEDRELLASDPDFYLDEPALRERAERFLERAGELQGES